MLVGINTCSVDNFAQIIEPVINREASDYIINHYGDLVKIIKANDIKDEKAIDLLHDVYISIVEAENNGCGFNMEYGTSDDDSMDNLMTVEQFVIGRIKLYAKNDRYRTDVIEVSKCNVVHEVTYYDTEINNDGTTKKVRKTEKRKETIRTTSNAASFEDGDDIIENNDSFQRAYAVAQSRDDVASIDAALSLREQIDYCIDICGIYNFNILNIFKNIDLLSELTSESSKRKKTSDSVFEVLCKISDYHDELCNNIIDIIRFAASNREEYDMVLANY